MEQGQIIADRWEGICLQMLVNSRTELYLEMRYLDLALSGLDLQITTELEGIGTDGRILAAHPKILSDLFEKDRRLVNRVYLHIVVHCLLRHLFKKPRKDAFLWRLSCDIAAESIIDSMHSRCIRTGISRLRMNVYDRLRRQLKVLTAEGIYHVLTESRPAPYQLQQLQEAFCIDDHSLWPGPEGDRPSPQTQMLQEKWQDISEKTQTSMESFSKESASGAGDMLQDLKAENRERYDYKGFLRRFAVFCEEMQVDPDSFDYVFYTFGLSMYGNMPLIEPQEFREVKRIEEFVIVLDVSMSTSGDLVKTFLNQTYEVLSEEETFLKKVHIRILQADEQVRSDRRITCREELESYMKEFRLVGGGGTDFRPAFDYVQKLSDDGEFTNLRGMIYFTDGHGIYPRRKPAWDTAFVFMEEDFTDAQVPPWAIKLIVDREEFEEEDRELRTDFQFV